LEFLVPFLDFDDGRDGVAAWHQVVMRHEVDGSCGGESGVEFEFACEFHFVGLRKDAMLALLEGEGNPIVLLAEGDRLPGTVGDTHFHGQAFVTQILLLIQKEIDRNLGARKNGCEAKDDCACKSSHSDSLKGRIADASRNRASVRSPQ
jgi:hypothetical protein